MPILFIKACMPVSRDRVFPLEISPRRFYFNTDSPPPEDLFQYRISPRRLYSKTKSPEERECFISHRNKLSPGGVFISMRFML